MNRIPQTSHLLIFTYTSIVMSINITVGFPDEIIPVSVKSNETMAQLKKKLCDLKKIPEPLPFWLLLNNVILTDDSLISETAIKEGTTIIAQSSLSVTFPLSTNRGIAIHQLNIGLSPDRHFIPVASSVSESGSSSGYFSYHRVNVNAVVLSTSIGMLTAGVIGASFLLSRSIISIIISIKEDKDFHEITRASVAGGLKSAVVNLDSIRTITANIGETLSKSVCGLDCSTVSNNALLRLT